LVAIKLNWFIAPLFGQIYKHYSFLLALSHFNRFPTYTLKYEII
jgi:hypothetical protein